MSDSNDTWLEDHIVFLGALALFTIGGFCLPNRRARWSYILILPLIIAGCYFLRDGGRTPASESSWWWYGEFHQTPASWFFFGLAVACAFITNAECNKRDRARRAAAYYAAQLEADTAWIDQGGRTVVEATVRSHNDAAPSQSHTASLPALWLPSTTERRVRRGGTTLGGTPIKDRRTVNPETLDDF